MKQFNHESGKIEGNASYNFHVGKGNTDKILLPDSTIKDLNGKKLEMMKSEAGVKSDEDYEKEINEINEYNTSILTPDKQAEGFYFNGAMVLIKLFKHKPFKKIGNLYVDNKLIVPYQTEGGKIAKMENPLQFIHAGVIHAVSDQCSDVFKTKFKPGSVIHLKMGLNLMQQRCWLNIEDYYDEVFDNWFLVNEHMIEKGVK